MQDNLFSEAVTAVYMGFSVVPLHGITWTSNTCTCPAGLKCQSPGKHPLTRNGLKDATTSTAVLAGYFARWPFANYGMVIPEDMSVLDVDVHGEENGHDTLSDLEATHGELPDTVMATTGGGGLHVFFMGNAGGTRRIGPGVEIRANGAYVVGPGSRHASGKLYEWLSPFTPADTIIAEAPNWLSHVNSLTNDDGSRRGLMVDGPIPEGERNFTLYRIACALLRSGVGLGYANTILSDINDSRCRPPLGQNEVASIVSNAYRFVLSSS